MSESSKKSPSKHILSAGISLAVVALASPVTVMAQDIAAPAQPGPAEDAGADIVVTGTRIVSPQSDGGYIVTSLSDDYIRRSGETNLTELLVELPALTGSLTSQRTGGTLAGAGGAGSNFLDLRNLGPERTLVLVNGRRHVSSSSGTSAVDINIIPLALIERVDVLTGGASPIYGADGVSGVVNFVMKRDFDGIEANLQNGISSRGDAAERLGSITAGRNFADGAGNVAVSYEYRSSARVRGDARRSGRAGDFYVFARNPADRPDNPSLPDRIPFNDVRYLGFSGGGAADMNIDGLPDRTGTGGMYNNGTILQSGLTQGGDSTPVAGFGGDLQPKVETHNVNLLASYEFTPALRLYAEGKFASVRSFTELQPTRDNGNLIRQSNGFLPDALKAAIVPGAVAAALGAPPGAVPEGFSYSRDNFDFGIRSQRARRETVRGVIGAEGEIGDHARYDVSYTYGRTTNRFTDANYRIADRYFASLDSVRAPDGSVVCRSTLNPNATRADLNYGGPAVTFTPGAGSTCVPVNVFGAQTASQAALDFFMTDLESRIRLTQHVVTGYVSGDFGEYFELPGGPVRFAIGGEYRKESSSFTPDQLWADGLLVSDDRPATAGLAGSYDVKEGFAELQVPVLEGRPGAELLQFGAAIRFSDYSTVGTTTTWKVDGAYAPIPDVRFKASYSHSVRAPNIVELFTPSGTVPATLLDPCSTVRVANGTQYRAANCAALLSGLGVSAATFNPDANPMSRAQVPSLVSGNSALNEETAKTWTAGIEFKPRMVPGLVAGIDWYDIKLTNAINTPTAQQLVNLCVDQPTIANPFCANVTRNAATGATKGFITGLNVFPQNVANFRTAGADFRILYAFEPRADIGRFDVRVSGGYLDRLSLISLPGATASNELRQRYKPEWSGSFDLAWTISAFSVNYGLNYFGKTLRFTAAELVAQPDLVAPGYRSWSARWEHDVQVAVTVADESATVYAGVNNIFDRMPDFDQLNYPTSFRGRFLYAGIRAKLD